jgi:hypothetical protein
MLKKHRYAIVSGHINYLLFMLPKPFAKVNIRFGQMMTFQHEDDENDFEIQRVQLERVMLPGLIRPL